MKSQVLNTSGSWDGVGGGFGQRYRSVWSGSLNEGGKGDFKNISWGGTCPLALARHLEMDVIRKDIFDATRRFMITNMGCSLKTRRFLGVFQKLIFQDFE